MRAHEFINEIFDRPWELETNTLQTDVIKNKILKNGNGKGGLIVYQKKDDPSNIIFIIYNRGYWEVHHVYDDGSEYHSGTRFKPSSMGGLGSDINAGFVATAIKLYKELLDKGNGIRVTATTDVNEKGKSLWDSYSKFIKFWLNKNPNFMAGPVVRDEYSIQGYPEISQTIRKYGKKWIEESLNDSELLEQRKTILREYKRDITARQYGNQILSTWKKGADVKRHWPYTEFVMLGLDGHDATDEKILDRLFHLLENADPTPNKIYTPWLAREYANGSIKRLEDLDGLRVLLSDYHRYKNRRDFPADAKDIMRLSASTGSNRLALFNVLSRYTPPDREEANRGSAETVYEDGDVRVIHPKDERAACYYGQGTQWCTAATRSENYFNQYNSEGPLYILLPKNPQRSGEKYQLHFESNQFMNESDNPVDLKMLLKVRFPQLEKVFMKLAPKLQEYIDFIPGDTLMEMYRVGAKIVVDNIPYLSSQLSPSRFSPNKLGTLEQLQQQVRSWFDDYRTERQVKLAINSSRQAYNNGYGFDYITTVDRFPLIYGDILSDTLGDFRRHNAEYGDDGDLWKLYITPNDVTIITNWVRFRVDIYTNEFLESNKTTEPHEIVPIDDKFSYRILKSHNLQST